MKPALQKKELSKALAHFNLPNQDIDTAVNRVRQLQEEELPYFSELTDLVLAGSGQFGLGQSYGQGYGQGYGWWW